MRDPYNKNVSSSSLQHKSLERRVRFHVMFFPVHIVGHHNCDGLVDTVVAMWYRLTISSLIMLMLLLLKLLSTQSSGYITEEVQCARGIKYTEGRLSPPRVCFIFLTR